MLAVARSFPGTSHKRQAPCTLGRTPGAYHMALTTLRSPLTKPAGGLTFLRTEGGANAAHYQSSGHKAWRRSVLERDHFRCVKCGAGGPGVRLYADHVREITDGGDPLDVANGQTLCGPHHNEKTAEARRARLDAPTAPRR